MCRPPLLRAGARIDRRYRPSQKRIDWVANTTCQLPAMASNSPSRDRDILRLHTAEVVPGESHTAALHNRHFRR